MLLNEIQGGISGELEQFWRMSAQQGSQIFRFKHVNILSSESWVCSNDGGTCVAEEAGTQKSMHPLNYISNAGKYTVTSYHLCSVQVVLDHDQMSEI